MTLKSNYEVKNDEKLFDLLKSFDSRVHYIIWKIQKENISPEIIETYIRFLLQIMAGEKYGTVITNVQAGKIIFTELRTKKSFDDKLPRQNQLLCCGFGFKIRFGIH